MFLVEKADRVISGASYDALNPQKAKEFTKMTW